MKEGNLLNRKKDTLVYQLTSWYVWWFATVLFLIGLIILATVSYFLFQRAQQEMEAVETRLALVMDDRADDPQEALDDALYPNYADYLVEVRRNGKVLAQSRGWEDEAELEEAAPVPWQDQLVFEEEFFYINEVPWKSGTISIMAELEDETEFLSLIFQILVYTGIASLAAGSVFLYRLTRKRLRPLSAITDAVGKRKGTEDVKKRVPVPNKPRELTELARAFNHSLDRIEEQFEREKSFVSNASHELRTPLTAFRGHLNLIKRWGKDNPVAMEKSIEALDHESRRMERMMEQMLLIARNEHVETRKETVQLTAVVERVIAEFPEDKRVKMVSRLEKGTEVNGDEEQLRQVAVILIENARRYTSEGTITVELSAKNEEVELSVADTGVGIPEEEQSRIFDRFYRVDKDRARQSGGTGLGLSIARELVKNHNGTIQLESEPQKGSTFTVVLPK